MTTKPNGSDIPEVAEEAAPSIPPGMVQLDAVQFHGLRLKYQAAIQRVYRMEDQLNEAQAQSLSLMEQLRATQAELEAVTGRVDPSDVPAPEEVPDAPEEG